MKNKHYLIRDDCPIFLKFNPTTLKELKKLNRKLKEKKWKGEK